MRPSDCLSRAAACCLSILCVSEWLVWRKYGRCQEPGGHLFKYKCLSDEKTSYVALGVKVNNNTCENQMRVEDVRPGIKKT